MTSGIFKHRAARIGQIPNRFYVYRGVRDLLTQPLWQASDLGHPIPDSPHAVSVAMPTWDSVIGYEEGDPQIMQALQCGYPRFFCHPNVRALFDEAAKRHAQPGETAIVMSSPAAAQRCGAFLRKQAADPALPIGITSWPGSPATVVTFPQEHRAVALRYWRYTGEIISSRHAEALLSDAPTISNDAEAQMKARLAAWSDQPVANGHLYASGMAAIFAAFRAATHERPEGKTLQLEFPYVDAYCIQKHLGQRSALLLGHDLLADLDRELATGDISAVFCEVPCNPLMRTVDLPAISKRCRQAQVPLIVDDTLGTVQNVDVYPLADLVTTSLTKNISGCGDVMAGSLWVCQGSPYETRFNTQLCAENPAPLHAADAAVLLRNSEDFPERMTSINGSAAVLAEWLAQRPEVEEIAYPNRVTAEAYHVIKRPQGGYGGLISIVLKGGSEAAKVFYDVLETSKGPSLGTNYTLVCPYTLLAHYDELDWAASCGVSQNLIRIAVGMEPIDELLARFDRAFRALA